MRLVVLAGAALVIGGCATQPEVPPSPPPVTIHRPQPPTGMSIIGTSTFGTILTAPPSPAGDIKPNRPSYRSQYEWYAQEYGISVEEARKRNAEQQALMPAFAVLRARLQANEKDNYIDVRMVHQPDWAYVFYFKRDPEATLRKYSVNPRFKAAKGGATAAELQAIADPWVRRFIDAGIMGGYGINATEGRIQMMMAITASEFRTLADAKGWGPVPAELNMEFPKELMVPAVDPRVAGFLRGFASENRATTIQPEAGYEGRVILDDGCLRLESEASTKGPLVVFHKETGIGLDEQGYLATIDRNNGKATGRIGEMWSWAGPNGGTEFDGLPELKAACGDGPIANVGNPQSLARFNARYRGN